MGRRGNVSRVRCPRFDPRLKIVDHVLRQLSAGRHLKRLVLHGLQQQRLVRRAGNDGRSAVAAGPRPLAAVEQQPAPQRLRIGRMAFVTMLYEHRPDLRLEEPDPLLLVSRLQVTGCPRAPAEQNSNDPAIRHGGGSPSERVCGGQSTSAMRRQEFHANSTGRQRQDACAAAASPSPVKMRTTTIHRTHPAFRSAFKVARRHRSTPFVSLRFAMGRR